MAYQFRCGYWLAFLCIEKAEKRPTELDTVFQPSVERDATQPVKIAHNGPQAETWADQLCCCAPSLGALPSDSSSRATGRV